ncbi:MAG TPA: precorrin-6A synthase (deacetylating) [Polyangiales bacterium]|nr:precorrin-6A synthase (deacetylating) [Polyangiales bacterium]
MRTLYVIGIGVGNPEHLTMQAIAALNRVDVFFVNDKGGDKEDLLRLRKQICARYIQGREYRVVETPDSVRDPSIDSYQARVARWHGERAQRYEQMIAEELAADGCGGFLVWGDPSLYDSTLRILDQVRARGQVEFACEVIPGISSVQALAASHKIALNRIGGAIQIITGRQLMAAGIPPKADDVVVMLDGDCAFRSLDRDDLEIYWSAYLGTPHEISIAGRLRERASEIVQRRAAARAEHGWIMDIYLLRRTDP